MTTANRSRRRLAALAALAALMATAACGVRGASEPPGSVGTPVSAAPPSVSAPTSEASPAVRSVPTTGPIQAGTYLVPKSPWSVTDFVVTLPEGWAVQYGHLFHKHPDADDELGLYPVVVESIYADACAGSNGALLDVGPSVDDLVAALREQAGPVMTEPAATTLGGFSGTRVDLTVPDGFDLGACNAQDVGLQVWYSEPADKYFVLLPDMVASVYILDVGGTRQVFLAAYLAATSRPDRTELADVLASIRLEP